MKKISEVGHSKNVANLEDVISYCTSFGSTYNPSVTALQLTSLAVLKINAVAVISNMINSITNYKNAVIARHIIFNDLKLLAPRVMNALKAGGADEETMDTAKAYYRKLMGRTKKKAKPETAFKTGEDAKLMQPAAKTYSTSQHSFDSRLDYFSALIDLVSTVNGYAPNEADLSVSGLNSFLVNLKAANTLVITTTSALSNARNQRNTTLYHNVTGLVVIANEVKAYVASVYGKKSGEYKSVNKLKFKHQK